MNRSPKFFIYALLASPLPIIGALLFQLPGFMIGLLLVLAFTLITACIIVVKENEIGVIRSHLTGAITALKRPGIHLIFLPFEHLWISISTLMQLEEGTIENIRSADGVPLDVHWWVSYQTSPFNIPIDLINEKVPALLKYQHAILRLQVEKTFRTAMGQMKARDLCSGYEAAKVTRILRNNLQKDLWLMGFSIEHVALGEILAPGDYQMALTQATGRQVDAEAQSLAFLTYQHDAEHVPQAVRDWLLNLEQLWAMRNTNASQVYLSPMRQPADRAKFRDGTQP